MRFSARTSVLLRHLDLPSLPGTLSRGRNHSADGALCLYDLVDRIGEHRGVHADQTRDHAGHNGPHVVVSQTRLQHDAGDRTGDVAHRQGIDIG